jgi:CheY-like chemotaxis protein
MTGSGNSNGPLPEEGGGIREEDDSWGDLEVDSGGRGEPRSRSAEPRTSVADALDGASRLDGLRLLVIDNAEERIDTARAGLEELGVQVAAGGPDESGYLRALEFRPDVVLSDLTTPGEPGWWLFQRFRRQPLLKWTPVLLMRWWERDRDGALRLLVSRVTERTGEILAPIRVIEERIAAGRALADRVEVTGIPALLKLLGRAGLTGVLSVNDSWNVFEVTFNSSRVSAVVRRGVDGEVDGAQEAFAQLLLCDSGRWSFRVVDGPLRAENMPGGLEEALDAASGLLASLFGPAATCSEGSAETIGVRRDAMRDVASSLSGAGRQMVEALADGISRAELDGLLRSPADLVSAERALVSLMRCGAVRPFAEAGGQTPDEADSRVARLAAYLLGKIAEDHRVPVTDDIAQETDDPDAVREPDDDAGKGFYRVSKVTAERVALKARESMNVPGAGFRPQVGRIDLTPADSAKLQFEAGAPTPVLEPDSMAWAAGLRSSTVEALEDGGPGAVMLHDSLVPAPAARDNKGKRQMWLALALALLLGGLLVVGLVIIGSDSPELAGEIDSP